MNTILVSGAEGFIGKPLCKMLSDKGNSVIALVFNKKLFGHDFKQQKNIKIVEADITKKLFWKKIGKSFDFCVHLAGISDANHAEKNPKLAYAVNVTGTKNILLACKKLHAKGIILASSNKGYGKIKNKNIDENCKLSGKSVYARTKILAEKQVLGFCKKNKISAIVARQTNVYGPSDKNIARLIPATIVSILKNQEPNVTCDASQTINLIYVDDMLDFYLKAIKYLEKNNGQEIINATNSEDKTVKEVINKIKTSMGKTKSDKSAKPNAKSKFSNKKAEFLLAWKPKTGFEQGIKATIKWYKKHYGDICTKQINI